MDNKIKKILLVRFGAIGDVVHTTALFRAIKKLHAGSEIHYVTFKVPALLIENDPDIQKTWVLKDKSYKNIFRLGKELRKEKFDLIINLQPYFKAHALCFLAEARNYLVYKKTYKMHAVKNFWSTAKSFFKGLELDENIYIYVPKNIKEKIKPLIKGDERKIICFNMGVSAGRHGRKWPFKYWVELANMLFNKYNTRMILIGGDKDLEESEKFMKLVPNAENFTNKLSIIETASLMSFCDIVISGDTGPLHLGTSVGPTCIGIYGCPPVSRTGPYGKKHLVALSELECVPCAQKSCRFNNDPEDKAPCMFDIKPQKIMDLVDNILNQVLI